MREKIRAAEGQPLSSTGYLFVVELMLDIGLDADEEDPGDGLTHAAGRDFAAPLLHCGIAVEVSTVDAAQGRERPCGGHGDAGAQEGNPLGDAAVGRGSRSVCEPAKLKFFEKLASVMSMDLQTSGPC